VPPDRTLLVDDPEAQSRKLPVEIVGQLVERAAVRAHDPSIGSVRAQRIGNEHAHLIATAPRHATSTA